MLEETSSKINKKIIGNIPIYISILFTFLFNCYWLRKISREINLNNKKKILQGLPKLQHKSSRRQKVVYDIAI